MTSTLTERECQVIELVARGYKTREIGDALKIIPRTAEIHRAKAIVKLKALNSAHAVGLYLTQKLKWATEQRCAHKASTSFDSGVVVCDDCQALLGVPC